MRGWKPWTTQPPDGTPIDWQNPLAQGLVFAYLPGCLVDLVGGRSLHTVGTAYPLVVASSGRSAKWSGAGSLYVLRDPRLEPAAVTLSALAQVVGTTADNTRIIGKTYQNSGGAPYLSWDLEVNTANGGQNLVNGIIGSSGNYFRAGATLPTTTSPFLATLCYGGSGSAFLYHDAQEVASVSVGGAIEYDTTTTGDLIISGQSSVAASTPLSGRIFLGLVWGRALSGAEMASYGRNPWQLYWKRRRTYSVPASTGASGSAAITEGADATLATGTLSVSGSAAVAEAADPSSGAGNIGDAATAAITEPADGVAATGALSVAGSATINEAADTGTGTGATGDAATAAIAEPSDAAVATGALSVTGSASIAEGADASTGAGALGTGATAAITEGADAIAGTGALSVGGLAAILEGGDIIVATGAAGSGATASIAEGADTIAGVGGISVDGTGVVAEGADLTSGTGAAGAGAHGAIAEEGDAVAASGSITIPGAMALLEGDDLAGAFGALGLIGSALITEGADTVYGMSAPPPDAACTLGAILINRSTLQIAAARSAISLTANLSTIRVLQ